MKVYKKITCPFCGKEYDVDDDLEQWMGGARGIECKCGTIFSISTCIDFLPNPNKRTMFTYKLPNAEAKCVLLD